MSVNSLREIDQIVSVYGKLFNNSLQVVTLPTLPPLYYHRSQLLVTPSPSVSWTTRETRGRGEDSHMR